MSPTSPDKHELREIGTATTLGEDAGSDTLEPARAVRRALADARVKASEVRAMTVSSGLVQSDAEATVFARLALGPHGDGIVRLVSADTHVAELLGAMLGPGELGVAVQHSAGITLARCLRRTSPEDQRARPDQRASKQ